MDREAGLNRDAGETIARLDWEQAQIVKAHEGHETRLSAAAEASPMTPPTSWPTAKPRMAN